MSSTSLQAHDADKAYINALAEKIQRYQKSYYTGEGEISDAEFDALWDELKALDPENPVLSRVGSDLSEQIVSGGNFEKATHLIPMGSQEKAADPVQFAAWAEKHNYQEYLVEYKLDGASLELQYQNGVFVKAVTRGDGTIGDDITRNVLKMNGVVQKLSGAYTGGVRGEVIMSHEVHKTFFADKANCRNAANGIMKRKDGTGSEHLRVICYDAFFISTGGENQPFSDERQKMQWLSSAGFETVPVQICRSVSEIIQYRLHIMDIRSTLPYDIDGLVIKNPEIDMEDASRTRPDKQIAFKFSLEEAVSVVRSVAWNENGATYTPVAEFDTVELAGTKVSRASLANPNTIQELGLCIGSHVVVTKRGEIIPKIESVVPQAESTEVQNTADDLLADMPLFAPVEQEQTTKLEPVQLPSVCGTCGTLLVNEGTRLYCPNKKCPKRVHHQLEKWIDVIGIRDFGTTLISSLFDAGDITSISGIYTLTEQTLTRHFLTEDSIGKEKVSLGARKVLASIQKSRHMTLAAFVAGFDIEGIGETMMEKLSVAGFSTLESLFAASESDITAVFGFADITAHTLVSGLRENEAEMKQLVSSGTITLEVPNTDGTLSGKSFCFTGELFTMKRQAAEKLVKDRGGVCKSSVTKDLTYLVTNDKTSGSSKNKKAAEWGISIIDENQFLELVR